MTNDLPPHLTGNAIRKTFIDFFVERGHTFVPSSSLVPGGDATLLFTNSGMVQFKDVFLGTDRRTYTRAANSQKCMRVAGKHNDLDDVGRDDTHHTFFEMLGNWSFGDYYKKEAIEWAWDLLTGVWGLPRENLYATVFKDDIGDIPTDEEAAEYWRQQPGFDPGHVFYFGRKDNFWEMAETGPCGPNSEIHIDLRPEEGPVKKEDLDTGRFLELWNLVFIQYNRTDEITFNPLPAKHVDTGLGFERIVAVLQGKTSNYRTDLLWPLIQKTQALTRQSDAEREANFTPYRVIADHARAAAFLIADGVTPGNLGRNYITRMIIRRAYRFGGKIGLREPFLAEIAGVVIDDYGEAYPELRQNRATILKTITREEEQFQRTLEKGTAQLEHLLDELESRGEKILPGDQASDLYTTHGMPLEITRDIARERGLEVDEAGFKRAMEAHRIASGAGTSMGPLGGEDAEIYAALIERLQEQGKLGPGGVHQDPYTRLEVKAEVLALFKDGKPVESAAPGELVEILIPETPFYLESGGQVDDTGTFFSLTGDIWAVKVTGLRHPAAGVFVHVGEVLYGHPRIGDTAKAVVDAQRRLDIMRNHTATHLLHAALHHVVGEHARQAGSLVAPDRLRFDFTHPEALTPEEIKKIEIYINEKILENDPLRITWKSLQQARGEGAMALFGEKYGEEVRTIRIGDFSYELCGGTHCAETGDIGLFLITSEGSTAAGIRRIEAITGREAYRHALRRRDQLREVAARLETTPDLAIEKTESLLSDWHNLQKENAALRRQLALQQVSSLLDNPQEVNGVKVLTSILQEATTSTLRKVADQFRERYPEQGVAVLAAVDNGRPVLVAAVTKDLNARGIKAGDLAGFVARQLGGGGGGSPTLAQAGGKDATHLAEALASVNDWLARII